MPFLYALSLLLSSLFFYFCVKTEECIFLGILGTSKLMLTLVLFSIAVNPLEEANFGSQKSKHPMSFAWSLQPLIGIFGTFINSFVLYIGYCERATFIRPVNAMIWYVPVEFSEL